MIEWSAIESAARDAALQAYAPYSNYRVGAALLAASGKLYRGCNVENASYGGTICAERVAFTQAVAAGEREFVALAIAAGAEQPATPCGLCRQVLSELCPPELPIHCVTLAPSEAAPLCFTLGKLLPYSFTLDVVPEGGVEPP